MQTIFKLTYLFLFFTSLFSFGQPPSKQEAIVQIDKLIKSLRTSDTALFESLFTRLYLKHQNKYADLCGGPVYYDTKLHLKNVILENSPIDSLIIYEEPWTSVEDQYQRPEDLDVKIAYRVDVTFKSKTKNKVGLSFALLKLRDTWLMDPEVGLLSEY